MLVLIATCVLMTGSSEFWCPPHSTFWVGISPQTSLSHLKSSSSLKKPLCITSHSSSPIHSDQVFSPSSSLSIYSDQVLILPHHYLSTQTRFLLSPHYYLSIGAEFLHVTLGPSIYLTPIPICSAVFVVKWDFHCPSYCCISPLVAGSCPV